MSIDTLAVDKIDIRKNYNMHSVRDQISEAHLSKNTKSRKSNFRGSRIGEYRAQKTPTLLIHEVRNY